MTMLGPNQCPTCLLPYVDDLSQTVPQEVCTCDIFVIGPSMLKTRTVKFCQYCGGQNLKTHRQVTFGDPGYVETHECLDCKGT